MPPTKELDNVRTEIGTEELRELSSFQDAIKLAQETLGAEVISSTDLGDGFALLKDEEKDGLIGKPCMFVTWRFADGDYGEFVSAHVMVELGKDKYAKYIINDGSTGICAQLRDLTDRQPDSRMLFAPKGLRRSDFTYTDGDGKSKPAHTYYVDTAPARQ